MVVVVVVAVDALWWALRHERLADGGAELHEALVRLGGDQEVRRVG